MSSILCFWKQICVLKRKNSLALIASNYNFFSKYQLLALFWDFEVKLEFRVENTVQQFSFKSFQGGPDEMPTFSTTTFLQCHMNWSPKICITPLSYLFFANPFRDTVTLLPNLQTSPLQCNPQGLGNSSVVDPDACISVFSNLNAPSRKLWFVWERTLYF